MPLSINVGLSRKASKDFQSTGLSINLTAELDQALLARPQELQQQIQRLYSLAEQAMNRQATAEPSQGPLRGTAPGAAARTSRAGNNGNGRTGTMTQSQNRAINAIGRRLGLDIEIECRDALDLEFGNLSIRDASKFIDYLKALEQPAGTGAGNNGSGNGHAPAPGGRNGGGR